MFSCVRCVEAFDEVTDFEFDTCRVNVNAIYRMMKNDVVVFDDEALPGFVQRTWK